MGLLILPEPVIDDYWVRWDPVEHVWEVSTDKGTTWRYLGETPRVQSIIGLGGPLLKDPTLSTGIIYFDGTNWQVYERLTGPRRLLPVVTEAKGGTAWSANGITAAANIHVWHAPYPCTVTEVRGIRRGGTSASINARRNGGATHLASNFVLTKADKWLSGGVVQNVEYNVGDNMEIMITAVAGSPTDVGVEVVITRSL